MNFDSADPMLMARSPTSSKRGALSPWSPTSSKGKALSPRFGASPLSASAGGFASPKVDESDKSDSHVALAVNLDSYINALKRKKTGGADALLPNGQRNQILPLVRLLVGRGSLLIRRPLHRPGHGGRRGGIHRRHSTEANKGEEEMGWRGKRRGE